MIDRKFKELLGKHDLVIIPADGVVDMIQDDLGLVRMTVGVGKMSEDTGVMIQFCNHDSFHRLGGDDD
jgi:hypothetical protein